MAASVHSLFVTGEAVLSNLKEKQTLIRMVINDDRVLVKDELDLIQDASLDVPNQCICVEKWLAAWTDHRWNEEGNDTRGCCWRIRMSPLVFSCLVYELKKSRSFRTNVLDKIRTRIADPDKGSLASFIESCPSCNSNSHLNIKIEVTWKGPFQIDMVWNCHLQTLIHERIELDEMLACLSTLGGAFSSMGDQHLKCAETAGQISLHQMQLAMRLGDVTLLAKCKLFMSLSLMQRGQVRAAERIIRAQYALAKSLPEKQRDTRLEKMCKGAWAKLQYIHDKKTTRSIQAVESHRASGVLKIKLTDK